MERIDWTALQVEYEFYGATADALATKYGISVSIIEERIALDGWSPKNDIDEYIDISRTKLKALSVGRQVELASQYGEVEDLLLVKMRSALRNLNPTEIGELDALTKLINSFASLTGKSSMRSNIVSADLKNDSSLTVHVNED